MNYRLGTQGPAGLRAAWGDWGRNYSFFSKHPGGCTFGFADGSTRFLSDAIDLTIYRQLATISGGESADVP